MTTTSAIPPLTRYRWYVNGSTIWELIVEIGWYGSEIDLRIECAARGCEPELALLAGMNMGDYDYKKLLDDLYGMNGGDSANDIVGYLLDVCDSYDAYYHQNNPEVLDDFLEDE